MLCLGYAAGVDSRDLTQFLGVFTPDAEVCVFEPPGTGDRPNRTMRGDREIGLIVERISYYSRTVPSDRIVLRSTSMVTAPRVASIARPTTSCRVRRTMSTG